eukprot:scaffold12750_cov106-Cylindrotheca_fusiformis.AAC.1
MVSAIETALGKVVRTLVISPCDLQQMNLAATMSLEEHRVGNNPLLGVKKDKILGNKSQWSPSKTSRNIPRVGNGLETLARF